MPNAQQSVVRSSPTEAAAAEVPDPTVRELFREHGRHVVRVLNGLGVAEGDVDDVVQEVFVIVHRKLPELAPDVILRAWIYGVCVRRAANYRKRKRSRREDPMEETFDREDIEQPPPGAALDASKARAILDAILQGLPDEKREVFVLHALEELPMHEVASALGLPLQTAYSRFYAARKLVEEGIRRARAQMGSR